MHRDRKYKRGGLGLGKGKEKFMFDGNRFKTEFEPHRMTRALGMDGGDGSITM